MELSEVTIKYLLSCSATLQRVKNKFSFIFSETFSKMIFWKIFIFLKSLSHNKLASILVPLYFFRKILIKDKSQIQINEIVGGYKKFKIGYNF